MSTKLNQKEYLKKYLSGGGEKRKKKKLRKSKHTSATVHIIDDDVHGDRNSEIDEELLLTGEDAPQIVGIIDASGSANGQSKWKSISGIKEERESEPRRSADDDLWGKKATSFGGDRSPVRRNPWRDQSSPRRVKERRSSDLSPPRRRNHSNGGEMPGRGRSPVSHSRRRDSDQSPPRRRQTRRDSDQSPPRRRGQPMRDERQPRDSDQSPPRRRSRARRESDQSPPRRRRDSDQSPARRRSPARRDLGAYRSRDSDQSLPRRRSPSRRNSGAGMRRDSDQSPPRRRSPARRDSGAGVRRDSDQSGVHPPTRRESGAPPRKSRWGSEHSPSRKPPAPQRADDDLSPVRVRRENPFNRSPPMNRTSRIDDDLSPVRVKRENPFNRSPIDRRVNGNPFKTPAIKKEKLSVDNSPRRHRPRDSESPGRVKRERRSDSPPPTHKMTKTLDGKRAGLQNAQTLKLETEERRRNEDRMFSKMSAELSGRDAEVQVRQSSAYRRRRKEEDPEVQRKRAEHEQQKKELYDRWNKGLKQIEAYKAKISDEQYESSKPLARYSNDADLDEMLRQQERDDDPMLEYMRSKRKEHQKATNIPVMPRYKGSFPENRFNIPPGYRWDGVDRSNGYERKWFDVQNQKKALADEAYKYSTEDM